MAGALKLKDQDGLDHCEAIEHGSYWRGADSASEGVRARSVQSNEIIGEAMLLAIPLGSTPWLPSNSLHLLPGTSQEPGV